jgi:4-amino-4-deoxy-L-arabinose transferase-like glycosyltransferase
MNPDVAAPAGHARLSTVSSLAIFLLAAAVRSTLLVIAVDVPGDGPVRAFEAYEWSRSPHWVSYGMWLPGLIYLGGVASMLIPNPAIAVRLLNVVAGALTASVVFAYVRQVYGSRPAWLAGLAIALFPLHATLSASSLSDPGFVLWVALAEYVLVHASASAGKMMISGVLALGLLVLAEMTRYEAWVLAPIFGAFFFLRSDRSWRSAAVLSTALIAFPVLWSIGNAFYMGDPFLGFTMARGSAVRSFASDLFGIGDSVARVARAARDHLTLPVALVIAGGFLLEVRSLVRRKSTPARVFHLALTAGFWLFAVGLAMLRGPKLYNRYLVLGFVLSFPLVGVALEAISCGRTIRWVQATCLLIAASVVLAGGVPVARPLWVTRQSPLAVIELTESLSRIDHRGQPILLTEMGWQSTYFLQYAPGLRWEIFAHREDDTSIRRRLEALRSSFLLVTRVGDESLVERIQRWAPRLAQLRRVHDIDGFYVLSGELGR